MPIDQDCSPKSSLASRHLTICGLNKLNSTHRAATTELLSATSHSAQLFRQTSTDSSPRSAQMSHSTNITQMTNVTQH